MSTLQIKNLPDEVHARLRERARAEHTTVSAYVTRVLEREVARPAVGDWLTSLRELPQLDRDIDVLGALDVARDDLEGP